ncbi:MAG: primosomal protein N' [Alphaproteobacteria bacterium]|nr:primosomal protein N' [Alphaproteobacteria bacterium]
MLPLPATLSVLLPLSPKDMRRQAFDYLPPAGPVQQPSAGALVEVPFGKKLMQGVVLGEGTGDVLPAKLRRIEAVLPLPPLPPGQLKFIDWVAKYTLSSPGAILRMLFAGAALPASPAPVTLYARAGAVPAARMTAARQKVWDSLAGERKLTAPALREASGAAQSVIAGMAKTGLLKTIQQAVDAAPAQPDADHDAPQLTAQQQIAADALAADVREKRHTITLLDGVTGAGKTEVYCEAIAACLRAGRQALVLMPEIALTTAMLGRFTDRFGAPPVEWHSALTEKQRRDNWWAIFNGKAPLVVGARSALFLPYRDLGLIVVDEEHDQSYKQEEGVIYNARDMAVVRGKQENFPVVLSSATPSLETWLNARAGKYAHQRLPDRYGGAAMPAIELIDIRKHKLPSQSWLSPPLVDRLRQTIAAGKQAMLFLNRRGYAPLTLCRACGYRLQCPNCSAWLVQHRHSDRLQCHHCGHHAVLPKHCPSCEAEGRFAACGPGVERVAEEVANLLPEARFAVMASDVINSPKDIRAVIARMEKGELDLLIGTQIMAKGYHFPGLAVVGVIDADLGLAGGDPRAAERTFQLLQQVAGRSGRAETPGIALVQTAQPEHPVMQALKENDRDKFLLAEQTEREAYRLPPFTRLAAFIISCPDARGADSFASMLARTAPQLPGLSVLGPAPAPISLLRGKHRRRLLLRCAQGTNIQGLIRDWLGNLKIPANIKLQVDIDPYSFM